MANPTTAKIIAGRPAVTGGALRAPLGTTLPTDATTALGAAFKGLGYISEDGLSENVERSTDKKKAWGGDVVKVVQTEFGATLKLTLIETLNTDVLKAVYGDTNVTETAPTTPAKNTKWKVAVNSKPLEHAAWAFEVRDGNGKIRIVVPDGQVTEIGEVKYTDSDLTGYEITISAFPDANGDSVLKYMDDGAV